MATRVGINGFGRIGRQVLRATMERHSDELEVVAVNDLADSKANAHLFKYDSTYGNYEGVVETRDGDLVLDGQSIRVFSERDPAQIPWSEMGVELVVESTGLFTHAEKASGHFKGGAKKVVISAPATGDDLCVVFGVNEHLYDAAKHRIVSNASCTTNCLPPWSKCSTTLLALNTDSCRLSILTPTTRLSWTNVTRTYAVLAPPLST